MQQLKINISLLRVPYLNDNTTKKHKKHAGTSKERRKAL
jgi:hypothetical protein